MHLFSLVLRRVQDCDGDETVKVTDSQPPVEVQLDVTNCLDAPACIVNCSVTGNAVAGVWPSSVLAPLSLDTTSTHTLLLWTPFGSCNNSSMHTSKLQCQSGGMTASMRIECVPTRWPRFCDAVVLLDNGMAKAAWAAPFNLSRLLVAAIDGNGSYTAADVAAAAGAATCTMNPLDGGADTATTRAHTSPTPFNVLVGEVVSRVYLVGQREDASGLLPPFSNLTRIYAHMNALYIFCNITWVSMDGWALQFQFPPREVLCPWLPAQEDCGYIPIQIITHADQEAAGVTVSCPPFCPRDSAIRYIPFPVNTTDGIAFLPAAPSYMSTYMRMHGSGRSALHARVQETPGRVGFYMTQGCTAAGYTDPSTGACTNTSDARCAMCAFGARGACVPCPTGALCPGGFRAWPLSGFYTAAESSGVVVQCPPPATARCVGWNASLTAVQCGPGYADGSYACSPCASGFFPSLEGTCERCAMGDGSLSMAVLTPIFIFVGSLVGCCAAIYGVIALVARLRSVSASGQLKRVVQLSAWVFTTLQVVAQVGRTASPSLSPLVLSVYSYISIFQFRGAALPSACIPGFPFANEVAAMTVSLFVLGGVCVLTWKLAKSRVDGAQPPKAVSIAYRYGHLALAVMYATVTNTVIGVLYCTDAQISAQAYQSLVGSTKSANTGTTVLVSLLHANPSILCYSGQHVSVASLAWCTAVLYCVLFPLGNVLFVWSRMRKTASDKKSGVVTCCRHIEPTTYAVLTNDAVLAPFIAGDYKGSVFWYPTLDRLYIITTALATSIYGYNAPFAAFCVTTVALMCLLSVLVLYKPYVAAWKHVAKAYSLCLCLLAAILNMLSEQDASSKAVEPLSYTVVAASAGLLLVLMVAFTLDVARSLRARNPDDDLIAPLKPKAAPSLVRVSVVRRSSTASLHLHKTSPPQDTNYANPLFAAVGSNRTSTPTPRVHVVQVGSESGSRRDSSSHTANSSSTTARGILSSRNSRVRTSVVTMVPTLTRSVKARGRV
jgi:hypothetical protein